LLRIRRLEVRVPSGAQSSTPFLDTGDVTKKIETSRCEWVLSIGLFIIGVYTHPHGARGACCEEPEAIRQRGCTTRSGSSPVRSRDRAAARHGFGWHRVLSPAKKIFDGCEARNGYSTRDGSPDLAHDCGFGSSEIDHDRWPESTTASTAWSSRSLIALGQATTSMVLTRRSCQACGRWPGSR